MVGYVGSDRRIGFWPAFFWSIILSPLIGIIITFNSTKKEEEEYRKKMLELQQNQLKPQNDKKLRKNLEEQLVKALTLYEKGIISEQEYSELEMGIKKDIDDLKE
ncbi:hypothetical protein GCM10011514_31170 [Emticicia aquatilis]|uniref:SHOCT domain-containing protein n=1 Tax=Emticicia aquatilis TaxID=1537369 RepID=A0A917DSM7_9BACT|nr:hypothetical protein GCM10011514_31170 [Emticicia aquatilis]